MYCINTTVHVLFFYVLLTLLNKYQIVLFLWFTVMVKKQLNILTSVAQNEDKNTLYFGGLGQITDMITRFWSMN